jgi:ssDNA-binding Zn-finger/Zn-ribbon topoisomerase 1
MIFKNIDDKSKQIETLKDLLSRSTSDIQKKDIERDLKKLKSGFEAEKENAYYLNFEFEKSKHLILLHDIRLAHDGRTAQFDHLLISRFGIELLETKSSKGQMTIREDGSINFKYGEHIYTYPNPLEQSRRHGIVLRDFIDSKDLLSKRIYLFGGIEITSKVLINPKTTLTNKKLPEGFERADSFVSKRRKEIDGLGIFKVLSTVSKGYSMDKAKEIAQMLVNAHNPVDFDYTMKFKMKKEVIKKAEEKPQVENDVKLCPRCNEGKLVVKKIKSQKAKEKYNNDEFMGCDRYPKCRYTENYSN